MYVLIISRDIAPKASCYCLKKPYCGRQIVIFFKVALHCSIARISAPHVDALKGAQPKRFFSQQIFSLRQMVKAHERLSSKIFIFAVKIVKIGKKERKKYPSISVYSSIFSHELINHVSHIFYVLGQEAFPRN